MDRRVTTESFRNAAVSIECFKCHKICTLSIDMIDALGAVVPSKKEQVVVKYCCERYLGLELKLRSNKRYKELWG